MCFQKYVSNNKIVKKKKNDARLRGKSCVYFNKMTFSQTIE